jgi:hypothetical protein
MEARQCKKDRMNEREKSDYETDNKRQQGKRGTTKMREIRAIRR